MCFLEEGLPEFDTQEPHGQSFAQSILRQVVTALISDLASLFGCCAGADGVLAFLRPKFCMVCSHGNVDGDG